MWKNKSGHGRTRFKGLHCYRRGVIPETLKHLPKLTSPQLPQQLDGFTVNLPLVHSVVWQAVSLRHLYLQQQKRGTLTLTDTGNDVGPNYSSHLHLLAWFAQTCTQAISLFGVMFHQLLQCRKAFAPRHEVVSIIHLLQPVMLHLPIVQHWKRINSHDALRVVS